jgi:hypothetical protein
LFSGGAQKIDDTSDEYFLSDIKKTHLLSDNSKLVYLTKLGIVQNEFFEKPVSIWWVINNPIPFKKALLSFGQKHTGRLTGSLSPSTMSQYIVPFISIINSHRELQEKDPELLHIWKMLKAEVQKPVEDHYDSNQPNEQQSKAMMTLSEISKIRDVLPDDSEAKLIIALYTMIPPVRNNFYHVRLYKEQPKDDEDNYMVLNDDPALYLNKYKTAKHYDTIKIELPDQLVDLIHKSLDRNPREYLFVNKKGLPYENANTFNKWANTILKRVLKNPNFNLTMFRHIYISDPSVDLIHKNRGQRKEIAHDMGHSTDTQDKYLWK